MPCRTIVSHNKNKDNRINSNNNKKFKCIHSADIMSINVEKKNGTGGVKTIAQKMINYALYEKSQNTVYEQQQSIAILTQKVNK